MPMAESLQPCLNTIGARDDFFACFHHHGRLFEVPICTPQQMVNVRRFLLPWMLLLLLLLLLLGLVVRRSTR